ncbi:hypothetical protein BDD12DRAFT_899615 [Trichophaea hybrida]|nr:hypothetical protein BDD12DRAFT_899615 [Trichophaea hybrida]
MSRSVVPRRWPRQSMVPPQPEAGNSSSNGDPWYHDPDYTDDTLNPQCKQNHERPRSDAYIRYPLEDVWAECYDKAEGRAVAREELIADVKTLRTSTTGGAMDKVNRAAREALAARVIAEAAQQETAELRTQEAMAEDT